MGEKSASAAVHSSVSPPPPFAVRKKVPHCLPSLLFTSSLRLNKVWSHFSWGFTWTHLAGASHTALGFPKTLLQTDKREWGRRGNEHLLTFIEQINFLNTIRKYTSRFPSFQVCLQGRKYQGHKRWQILLDCHIWQKLLKTTVAEKQAIGAGVRMVCLVWNRQFNVRQSTTSTRMSLKCFLVCGKNLCCGIFRFRSLDSNQFLES